MPFPSPRVCRICRPRRTVPVRACAARMAPAHAVSELAELQYDLLLKFILLGACPSSPALSRAASSRREPGSSDGHNNSASVR